jgi:hypothetical protein
VPTHVACTALPYPHRVTAAAGLRAQLRERVGASALVDWTTLTVTGPVEAADARGRTWYEYRAELTVDSD